jgi:hypothetical protein
MIPLLTPDQLSLYLKDINPTIAFLAQYIIQQASSIPRPLLLTAESLVALLEADSGVWTGDNDDSDNHG